METKSETTFDEQIARLPKEIIDFLASSSWKEQLDEIKMTHQLSEKESALVTQEVLLVLTGIVHVDAFRSMLAEQFERYDDALDAMAFEIDDKVFAPIRPALVEFFEKEQASHKEAEATTPEQSQQETEIPINTTVESINEPEKVPKTVTPTEKPRVPAEFFPETQKTETEQSVTSEPSLRAQALELAKMPSRIAKKEESVIPEGLPTQEASASFLPNLAPKTALQRPLEKTASFEDKLKRTFTSGTPVSEGTGVETAPKMATPEREEPRATTISAQIFPEKPVVPSTTPLRADPYREPIE